MPSSLWSSRSLTVLLLAGVAAAVTAGPAAAGAPVAGPYVSLGAGTDFQQNETVSAVPGLLPERTRRFDQPGFSGEVSVGYGLGNGLRVELEGNYLNDHIRKISYPGEILRAGGYQQQYGGFANVLYDIPVSLPFTPYVGLGAGAQALEFDHINSSPPGVRLPPGGVYRSIGSFAYQAIAGVSVPVPFVRGLAFTTEYRLIGLPDPLQSLPIAVTVFGPQSENEIKDHQRVGNVFHHSILFGLRYAFDTAPPPPPPVPPAPPAPAPAEAHTYLVFFDWDRSELTARAVEIVAGAAQASTHVQTTRIEVNGYTDSSSIQGGARGARYNDGLSVRRAASVKLELIRDGVPAAAIDIHGYGDTHPLVATGPNTREPQNRRVEIVLN